MTSEAETSSNVAYAYLALLLCLLCLDPDIKSRVSILGHSSLIDKMAFVVEDFLRLARQVEREGEEDQMSDIERMEAVVKALRSQQSR